MSEQKLEATTEEKAPSTPLTGEQILEVAIRAAVDQKALDVIGLEVREITDITDYVMIASGTSERHTSSTADKIKVALKKYKEAPQSVTGTERGEWVILDYGNVVVHLFHESYRQFYRLEELWSSAKPISIPEEIEHIAEIYRTKPYP